MKTLSTSRTRHDLVVAAIVNFNHSSLTIRALESLLANKSPRIDLVPMVIDNGSDEGDWERLVAGTNGAAEVIRVTKNGGYAAACNIAISVAIQHCADAVWLLNNDIILAPDVLELLSETLFETPAAAAVAPILTSDNDSERVLTAGANVTLWRGRVKHRFAGLHIRTLPEEPFRADALEASAILIRLSAIKEIGLFDEGFFMYWEDTEWSCRARKQGWVLLVQPKARVTHAVAASSTPLAKVEFMLRNRWRFVRVTANRREVVAFTIYFLCLWLPAYALTRLIPQFGVRRSWRVLWQTLSSNVADLARTRSIRHVGSSGPWNPPS